MNAANYGKYQRRPFGRLFTVVFRGLICTKLPYLPSLPDLNA